MSSNDITGDALRSRGPSKAYDEGYARIFGGKNKNKTPSKYRKKPVEIEAIQFIYGGDDSTTDAIKEFCGDAFGGFKMARHPNAVAEMEIKTLEDGADGRVTHVATNRDYIIKGVAGEFYACKPDIFEQTYEKV